MVKFSAILALQYLPAAVEKYGSTKTFMPSFGIHGFWPDANTCSTSHDKENQFCSDMSKLSSEKDLKQDLIQYWPDVIPKSNAPICKDVLNENLQFWFNEYRKHGSCEQPSCKSIKTPLEYLKFTLTLSKPIIDGLNKMISVDNTPRTGGDLLNSIAKIALPNVNTPSDFVKLICHEGNKLLEVRITFPYSECEIGNSDSYKGLEKGTNGEDVGNQCSMSQEVKITSSQEDRGLSGLTWFFIVCLILGISLFILKYKSPQHFDKLVASVTTAFKAVKSSLVICYGKCLGVIEEKRYAVQL